MSRQALSIGVVAGTACCAPLLNALALYHALLTTIIINTNTNARTRARTHTYTHAHTHVHARTHVHTPPLLSQGIVSSLPFRAHLYYNAEAPPPPSKPPSCTATSFGVFKDQGHKCGFKKLGGEDMSNTREKAAAICYEAGFNVAGAQASLGQEVWCGEGTGPECPKTDYTHVVPCPGNHSGVCCTITQLYSLAPRVIKRPSVAWCICKHCLAAHATYRSAAFLCPPSLLRARTFPLPTARQVSCKVAVEPSQPARLPAAKFADQFRVYVARTFVGCARGWVVRALVVRACVVYAETCGGDFLLEVFTFECHSPPDPAPPTPYHGDVGVEIKWAPMSMSEYEELLVTARTSATAKARSSAIAQEDASVPTAAEETALLLDALPHVAIPAVALGPTLPVSEAKRDALQRSLATGWGPWLHSNMLPIVKLPEAAVGHLLRSRLCVCVSGMSPHAPGLVV